MVDVYRCFFLSFQSNETKNETRDEETHYNNFIGNRFHNIAWVIAFNRKSAEQWDRDLQ